MSKKNEKKTAIEKTILISGACGYVGYHLILELFRLKKYELIIIEEELDPNRQEVFSRIEKLTNHRIKIEKIDVNERDDVDGLFEKYKIDLVMILKKRIVADEQIKDPLKFYMNRIGWDALHILQAMKKYEVGTLILSSNPEEKVFVKPDVLYDSKRSEEKIELIEEVSTLMHLEKLLFNCEKGYELKFVSLRYYNVAGSDESGFIGEIPTPDGSFVSKSISCALGKKENVEYYEKYPTEDGTKLRDYVHVSDVALCHIRAMEYIDKKKVSAVYNIGTGTGVSEKEVISTIEKVSTKKVAVSVQKKKPVGVLPQVIVTPKKILEEFGNGGLGWKRKFPTFESIVETNFNFYEKSPNGYSESIEILPVTKKKPQKDRKK